MNEGPRLVIVAIVVVMAAGIGWMAGAVVGGLFGVFVDGLLHALGIHFVAAEEIGYTIALAGAVIGFAGLPIWVGSTLERHW